MSSPLTVRRGVILQLSVEDSIVRYGSPSVNLSLYRIDLSSSGFYPAEVTHIAYIASAPLSSIMTPTYDTPRVSGSKRY